MSSGVGLRSGPQEPFGLQVTVAVQVEASRKLCSRVAKGEVDAALIGGEVPIEIRHVLSVRINLWRTRCLCQLQSLMSTAYNLQMQQQVWRSARYGNRQQHMGFMSSC